MFSDTVYCAKFIHNFLSLSFLFLKPLQKVFLQLKNIIRYIFYHNGSETKKGFVYVDSLLLTTLFFSQKYCIRHRAITENLKFYEKYVSMLTPYLI